MNAFFHPQVSAHSSAFFDVEQFSVLGELQEEGDAEIILEVVGQFLEDVDSTLEKLEGGIANGSLRAVSDLAHTLKGSFATFGLMRAHALAREIEQRAQAGVGEGLATVYRAMLGCFLAGKHALQAHLHEHQLACA